MQAHVALAGQRVRSARRRAGLTQLQLALAAGIRCGPFAMSSTVRSALWSSPAVGKVNEILGLEPPPVMIRRRLTRTCQSACSGR